MSVKQHIRKIGIMALWIVLASGLLVLLAAAIKKKDLKKCNGVTVNISNMDDKDCFLNKKDVLDAVGISKEKRAEGRSVSSYNLQQLETALEKNVWVKDAELFFDNNLELHINIEERQPIARIFTVSGESFYIDSSGKKLPLNDKMNVRLPVFTGFTAERTTGLNKRSQKLVNDIRRVGFYILNDPFWSAQIAQIDIAGDGVFEMVPTVGKHVIEFGSGDDYELKFRRLFVFYKEVLSRTGFDKYSRIDVRYNGQIVGTKRGSITKVDSVQAIKNIEKLIMAGIAPKPDTSQIRNN